MIPRGRLVEEYDLEVWYVPLYCVYSLGIILWILFLGESNRWF